jgi:hypothetical protein
MERQRTAYQQVNMWLARQKLGDVGHGWQSKGRGALPIKGGVTFGLRLGLVAVVCLFPLDAWLGSGALSLGLLGEGGLGDLMQGVSLVIVAALSFLGWGQ